MTESLSPQPSHAQNIVAFTPQYDADLDRRWTEWQKRGAPAGRGRLEAAILPGALVVALGWLAFQLLQTTR